MNELNYTLYESPIGIIKIAATRECVCEILFIDQPEKNPESSSSLLLTQAAEKLAEYFSGQRTVFNIPMKQNGTIFQVQVWNELQNIHYGKTINYMDLAKRIGDPKAIRAAATTNGKNQLSVVVPCHRVIGSDKTLVGYAGGLWRKKWLLDHENKFANGVQTLF